MDCLRIKLKVIETKSSTDVQVELKRRVILSLFFKIPNVSHLCFFFFFFCTAFGLLLLLYPCLSQYGKVPAIPELDSGEIVYTEIELA